MNCAICQQSIPSGAKFCPNCGAFPDEKPAKPSSSSAPAPTAVAAVDTVPARRVSTKTLVILILSGFLVFGVIIVGAWLYFFPPWIYVRDSFRRPHPDIQSQIQLLGMKVEQGKLIVQPKPGSYTSFLYQEPASNRATVRAAVQLAEGSTDSAFGILCCATDPDNFTAFMVQPDGFYRLDRHQAGKWDHLTGSLRLPSDLRVRPGATYQLKLVLEGEYLTLYLNDRMLMKVLDDAPHHGLTGLYAEGGKSQVTRILFDSFESRKNSVFQKQ